MTDGDWGLSRRSLLGAVGTIGGAAALGGAGSMAFFRDEENFANNQLTAGTLDLKVAVSQHYVDWLPDTPTDGDVTSPSPQETDDAEMPDDGTPDIRLGVGSAGGGDTQASPIELDLVDDDDESDDGDTGDENALGFALGSLVNNINGGVPPGSRSSLCNDDDSVGGDDDDAERPIIDLGDVKPGDFGFVRFEFASCTNPAFVSVNGRIESASENGTTEPESEDPDEVEGEVELLDEVQLALVNGDVYRALAGLESGETLSLDPQATLRSLEGGFETPITGDLPAEDGGGAEDARNCFSGETNHRYTLVWWLPVDHANEIQTDTARFSLGITAEQCRHNSGTTTTLTSDSPQGQGAGFANPWDFTSDLAQTGSGAWGTVSRPGESSYKQGFYFGGEFSDIDVLNEFTVAEIEDISYWFYKDAALDGSDIYLNIYTQPENDGTDSGFYDSRLQALPSTANGGSPTFTPGEWNKFSTAADAANTLGWSDTGRGGNFVQSLPTLDQVQAGPVDWSSYGANISVTQDYRDEVVLALSLQTGSTETGLEAYIDNVTVELTTGQSLQLDLEP